MSFSESICARDDALSLLAAAPGLGPPDLCWLQKGRGAWSPGEDGAASGSQGYYHLVLGGDISSSGAIAGAFARLMSRVERPGLLAGLWSGSELTVQRGFYCCYDAISRTDLRCELCVPGGVVSLARSGQGINRQRWRARFTSACTCALHTTVSDHDLLHMRSASCCWPDVGGWHCCNGHARSNPLATDMQVCGVVDAAGNLHEASDQQLWQQAQVGWLLCAGRRGQTTRAL